MTDGEREITPSVSGPLPLAETVSTDRVGRVASGDLPTASPLDMAGMALVTSCVTTRFGLVDLIAEAAALGLILPVRLTFREPYAVLDGRKVSEASLLAPSELALFRKFVDGSVFKFGDGTLRAFLHAVVIAAPGEPTTGVSEAAWVAARVDGLVDRLGDQPERLALPLLPPPAAVVLWTVGTETPDRRGVRLRSGFVATLDRSAT